MCKNTEEGWKICREIDSSFQNWPKEFYEFWPEYPKVWKIYTLIGCFWPNYIIFELEKSTEELYVMTLECDAKFEEKTTLWFGKWHEEFGKFSPEHTKVSKLRLSLGSFIQSIKFMSLNNSYGVMELCLMTMKNDAKYENELTCQLKIDPRNL